MERKWWHNKVAYQIYPKSFYDSNGDGIGDIPGIIEKLDYLKELGVDIIWLSPVYRSPLADQGYDISDYYNIDPRFGTMEDMDRLLAEAAKRDLHIVMDLVVNHCSDEHEWFRRACEDPEGEYGRFFYLQKLRKAVPGSEDKYAACSPDGYVLPCNWRSYFGGPVWEKMPGHEDWFYLHVFHKKQPDLNWENPAVREEIYKMINWWLDRGLSGFRIDAIINIKKALPFRNYAPDRADGLCSIHRMLQDATGVGDFLGEMRDRTFAPHNAFTVGEVFNEKTEEVPDFIGENGYFSSMFDFSETVWGSSNAGWHANRDITPDNYRDCVFLTQEKIGDIGFISNIIENHDEPRGVSRYIPPEDMRNMDPGMRTTAKKALAAVYFFVKGLPWIYQGQEIGMENVHLHSIDEVDDIASIDAWNVMRALGVSDEDALRAIEKHGRDNARTPFQWSSAANAGFSAGTPWLRVNPNFTQINLEQQTSDSESVFNWYKKLIALRKDPRYLDTLVHGSFEPYLNDMHNVIAYLRRACPENSLENSPVNSPENCSVNSSVNSPVNSPKNNPVNTVYTRLSPASASGSANAAEQSAASAILVISNYQKETRELPLPAPVKKVLLNNCAEPVKLTSDDKTVTLTGYQTLVLEL